MLTIRFMRFGRKNQPFFRLVVVPKRSKPVRGKYVEKLGWYNPLKKDYFVDKEKTLTRIGHGAQVSDSAWNLLVRAEVLEGPKRAIHIKKKTAAQEAESAPPAEKPEEPAAKETPESA